MQKHTLLTSESEAFETQPVLKIFCCTTLTEEEAVQRSLMFTMLSNLILIFDASDSGSGATLSVATTLSDGVDVVYSCLFDLCKRSIGCDNNPSVSRVKYAITARAKRD